MSAQPAISALLQRLRRRARSGSLVDGCSRLLVLALLGVLAWWAVDRLLIVPLLGAGAWDVLMRALLSGSLLAVIGRAAWRGPLAELRRRRSDDELALRLEAAYPQLDGQLISAVQLPRAQASGSADAVGSADLIAALSEAVDSRALVLDHRPAWDLRPAWRALAAAGVAMLLAMVLLAWRGTEARTLLLRMVLLPSAYPTATRIVAVHVPALVVRGEPVTVEVEVDASAVVPAAASAQVRGASGVTTVQLQREGNRFRAVLPAVVEDLALRPQAGDQRWPSWVALRVAERPVLRSLQLRVIQPAYLDQAETQSTVGDVRACSGSTVRFTALASRPLAAAELLGISAAPLELSADGLRISGSFVVAADGWWSLRLRTGDGLAALDPPRWTITAIPDRAPSIFTTAPPRSQLATPNACWPVHFSARDDHAVATIRLCWVISAPGSDSEGRPGSLAVPASGAAVQGELPFDLAPLALDVGSRVQWWLEAEDACAPQPNRGTSQRGTLTIVDPRTLREALAREQAELQRTLKLMRDRQRDLRDAVEGLAR